jgi:probable rRNA maturation factor
VYQIDIANHQRLLKLDRLRLRKAARHVLQKHSIESAQISIAIVDDPAIHELNRRYLDHDYATDVLSFVLDREAGHLDGEVIASSETAIRVARQRKARPADELLLYVVHGLLHLVGFDDHSAADVRRMRSEEREILSFLDPAPRKPTHAARRRGATSSRSGRSRG